MTFGKLMMIGALALATVFAGTMIEAQISEAKVGYDLGACAPDGFDAPVHAVRIGKDLKFDEVSLGQDQMKPTDVTYQFVKEEKGYEYFKNDKSKYQIVIDFKDLKGKIIDADGNVSAIIFVKEDADGTKLAENGYVMYEACVALVKGMKNQDVQ